MTTTTANPPILSADAAPAVFPWFVADWLEVTFIHFAIDPDVLQRRVPFDLDLFDGKAWVSLVAFTQSDLRPARGGALTRWITRPVGRHPFLNLRTYVKAHGHAGIYFLAEWIPSRLSLLLGPPLYGLPFRWAEMVYGENECVVRAETNFHVERSLDTASGAARDELTHFLLERYTAFTCRQGRGRMFHIDHEPWRRDSADLRISDDTLIRTTAPWFADCEFIAAHHSPGVGGVRIGRPIRVESTRPTTRQASKLVTWAPLIVLPLLALATTAILPAWGLMWALAGGLFLGCKCATWRRAADVARRSPRWKSLAYLLAWPGMDAKAFLADQAITPDPISWRWPALKTVAGLMMLFMLPRPLADQHMILAGWAGMAGLILAMHFGCFELLALFWQRLGARAEPIMNAPCRSRALGEFWGLRWNRGFRDLSHGWLFRPLLPRIGAFGATYVTFAVSGLVHDLVISVPAGAGYFLPTLYFLFQAGGLLVERTPFARRRLRGVAGRLFTIAILVLPAPLLFHPPFVLNVIVPFLRGIGAM